MSRPLPGPRRAPSSGRPARQLVMLLHGYGASGDDLIGLADEWQARLPEAAFVAPHAPERLPAGAMAGYQWFDLARLTPEELARGTARAAPRLLQGIDAELAGLGLGWPQLALVGFSQGSMMALHVAMRSAAPAAAVVAYSGALAAPAELADAATVRPPVLLVHGAEDEVIPAEALHLARQSLAGSGVSVEWHVRPGLGHGIDRAGLHLGGEFLKLAFAGRLG